MNFQKETTNPTNNKITLKVYAVPLIMLVMAGALATPVASADVLPRGYRTVQADFHYNADAPAGQIYSKLRSLVQRMCITKGPRSLALRRSDQACMAAAMKDGISRIGRTDIAVLHTRQAG